jgi:biopolymer transport protein TolR
MAAASIRGGSRRRRTMSEINMVPFIDVMLVLLIIFMVSAPLITTGLVDLPSVGGSRTRPTTVIEVIVGSDESIKVKASSARDAQPSDMAGLPQAVRQLQAGDTTVPVVIAADKNVKYDQVVRVMDALQQNGVARIGLSVKQGP